MKIITLLLLRLLLVSGFAISQVPDLVPGWPYRSESRSFAMYALGRFADDGAEKHLFFNTMMGEMQKFNIDGSYSNGWPLYFDTLIFGSDPVILDIDHDGRFEMLNEGALRTNGGYAYSLLFLIDDNGIVMPGFPVSSNDPTGLAAADMDDDNEYEIIYFSKRDDIITCLDRYGVPKPGWPISLPSDVECVGGSIGDLDLDGTNEFIIPGQRNIYAYRYNGYIMDGFPIALEDTNFIFYNGIWPNVLVDFDIDGYLEIIMGANNWANWPPENESCFVAVYDHTGQPKPGWPHFLPEWIVSSITPSDIDNSGTIELGFQGYYLHFMGLDGTELPGWPVRLTNPEGLIRPTYTDLSVVDLDGDGDCEIFSDFNILYHDSLGQDSIWYYGYSYLYAIDHFGQTLAGYPLRIRGAIFEKPPCFSLDRSNNRLFMSVSSDIFLPEVPDSVYLGLYLFPDSTGPLDQWPMRSHDNLKTRNYNFEDRVTSIADEGPTPLPKRAILKQNYPNPFNARTTINFSLPKPGNIKLEVFDILGTKVATIFDGPNEAGSYSVNWDGSGMASGVYYYRLSSASGSITKRMVLMK